MKRHPLLLPFVIVGLAFAAVTFHSEIGQVFAQDETTKQPGELPRLDEMKTAFLIVCDSQPTKIIVLDSNGKWMSTVKTASIAFELGKPPLITCTMYAGVFKPTNPDVKIWKLAQMRSVTATAFQDMINLLQTDPDAVKKIPSDNTPAKKKAIPEETPAKKLGTGTGESGE